MLAGVALMTLPRVVRVRSVPCPATDIILVRRSASLRTRLRIAISGICAVVRVAREGTAGGVRTRFFSCTGMFRVNAGIGRRCRTWDWVALSFKALMQLDVYDAVQLDIGKLSPQYAPRAICSRP